MRGVFMEDKREIMRKQFGKRLNDLLEEKRMTKYQLAQNCGIDRANISKYITGERVPQMDAFLAICDELQVSPNYFLDVPRCDYVSDEDKSIARKIIESLVLLSTEGMIRTGEEVNGDNYNPEYDPDFILALGNSKVLNQVMEEIKIWRKSTLVAGENICSKICDGYEAKLMMEMNENAAGELSSDDLPF